MLCYRTHLPLPARRFIERLEVEIESAFFRYAESSRIDGFMYPAYWYGEQRTKTFVTLALGNLCAGSLLQEPPVRRNRKGDKSAGRVDYYCQFGGKSLFVEYKQVWVGNNRQRGLPLSGLRDAHAKVAQQIRAVDKKASVKEWSVDYGIGMIVAPLYSNYVKHKDAVLIPGPRLNAATDTLRSDRSIDAVSYFDNRVNNKPRRFIVSYISSYDGKKKTHEYPGVLILWFVRKF